MPSDSSYHKIKLEHFENLIAIAVADDTFKVEELGHLFSRAKLLGIAQHEIDAILSRADHLTFRIPLNQEDKEEQVSEAVFMSIVDGEIHFREYRLLTQLAERLDMNRHDVDHIIKLTLKLWQSDNLK